MDLCNISVIMFVFTLLKCMQIENRKNQTNRVFVVPSRVRVKTKIASALIIVLKAEKQMNNLKMTPSVANWMNLVCRVSYCFCVGFEGVGSLGLVTAYFTPTPGSPTSWRVFSLSTTPPTHHYVCGVCTCIPRV